MLSFSNNACVPNSTLKQQEFQKNKLAEDFKKIKKPIKPKSENKTVNTVALQVVQNPIKKSEVLQNNNNIQEKNNSDTCRKFVNPYKSTEFKKNVFSPPISNGYIEDCGFSASWVFKCAPYKPLPICVKNRSDGAWVPFIVQYNEEYMSCSNVKNGNGREFSQDYGTAYR